MGNFIVCSRPLDDRFKGLSKSITVGDEIFPIPPDEFGNGFDGGMMPSGTETYTEQLIDGKWHQETLTLSLTDAVSAIGKRLGRKWNENDPTTPQVGKEVTHKDGDFAYVILPATFGSMESYMMTNRIYG